MGIIGALDTITREATLFAAVGLLIGGTDDLLVDLVYIVRRIWHRGAGALSLAHMPLPAQAGRIIVMVPAWDEVAVIGAMLSTALARFEHHDYRIYVGVYPNDQPTIAAVARVGRQDDRVRMVINDKPGPTTKADCLNSLWRTLLADARGEGFIVKAIVLHDAEDVVHPAELRIFDTLIERHAVVQLPVLPLVNRESRFVSGHYADEFSEAHNKQLVVRTALGAGMPLAGTGCAIGPAVLATIAEGRGGEPFDSTSLTEDYELGLRVAELGGRGLFARVRDDAIESRKPKRDLVAVRAYFPGTLEAAIRQKARWMTGIALAGWDRTGWAHPLAFSDHWMRMRDRRAPMAMVVLAAAYAALLLWGLSMAIHRSTGLPVSAPIEGGFWLLVANALLLAWRLAMRVAFTGRTYGATEALLALPRFIVGNFVALLAAPRAVMRYVSMLRGQAPVWDKTRHEFPAASITGSV